MYYGVMENLKFGGGVKDSGEGRWTVHTAVDLGVPAPLYLLPSLKDLTQED